MCLMDQFLRKLISNTNQIESLKISTLEAQKLSYLGALQECNCSTFDIEVRMTESVLMHGCRSLVSLILPIRPICVKMTLSIAEQIIAKPKEVEHDFC